MNKTISVNLGGSIFNIEEDAYLVLKSYLERIKSNFSNDASVEEIMMDIEGRIAELFTARLDGKRLVVDSKDVEEIMIVMGRPEDFAPESANSSSNNQRESDKGVKHDRRRIYRDQDDAYIGGVCSGLSYYFGWDPIVLRIAFILLTFFGGSAIPAYIILWAVIPAANGTAEKLRMRGEPVTIDNISRFVNEEAKNATERVKGFEDKMKSRMQGRNSEVGRVFKRVFGALFVIFALFLLIGFVTGSVFTINERFGGDLTLIDQLIFQNDGNLWWLIIGVHLVVLMPIFAILYLGFRLLLENSKRVKGLSWILLSLFLIGIVILGVGGASLAKEFRRDNEVVSTIAIDSLDKDVPFIIQVNADTLFKGRMNEEVDYPFEFYKKVDNRNVYGHEIYFSIEETSSGESARVVIEKTASGRTSTEAGERANRIEYSYNVVGNTLNLDPVFSTPTEDPFRNQMVKVLVYLPKGTRIQLNENMRLLSSYWSEKNGTIILGEEDN